MTKKIVSAGALSFYHFVNIHLHRSKNDNLQDRQRHWRTKWQSSGSQCSATCLPLRVW